MKTLLMLAAAAVAVPAPKPAPAPSEIVTAAPKGDWVAIAPSDLLVMDLANGKRVVIQLMPPPFSQGWVGNVRKLAAARFWDGTSVNRVQDNYVVQWGDANGEDKAKAKQLPVDLAKIEQDQYTFPIDYRLLRVLRDKQRLVVEVVRTKPARINSTQPIQMADPYSALGAHLIGWPVASNETAMWPVHCYGMVGVGRDMPPDTGTGAELYTVIGHAPRHLDRNIALVGRVISGIEHLSSLPRGTGPLGFYEKPEERVGIASIRIGTDVKDIARFEYLSTESASFAKYTEARTNRRDPFFILPAGGADICNIPVPVRVVK
jgi:cyclophilin family peptidyl-prolyl cis-trans isomerase